MRQHATTARVRLALSLLAIGLAAALLVVGVEVWRVRAHYAAVAAGAARAADAAELAAVLARYTQDLAGELEAPDAGRAARLADLERELAARIADLATGSDTDEGREWEGEARSLHARLVAEAKALLATHDALRASHATVAECLLRAEGAEAARPEVARAFRRVRLAMAGFVHSRDTAAGRRFAAAAAGLDRALDGDRRRTAEFGARAVAREARAVGLQVEMVAASWSAVDRLREQLHVSLVDRVQSGLSRRLGLELAAIDASLGRLSLALGVLTLGVLVGLGTLAAVRARLLGPLREQHGVLEGRIAERTRELTFLSTHDTVTGLLNRTGFAEAVAAAIESASQRRDSLAILLLDLDGFKAVNDTLGHEQGDQLLRAVAHRLRTLCRGTDVVARLGGDEFGILLRGLADPHRTAEIAERCLSGLVAPVQLSGRSVAPRASIGIAVYPGDARDAADLVRAADTAMYAAKHAGKHRYLFYQERMTHEVEEQMALEAELRTAVENGAFRLVYQPQVALNTGRLSGVEALIRWPRRGHGLVGPDVFIPVAERIGLIGAIGDWVLRTACVQAAAWRRQGLPPFDIAVNISPTHFCTPEFVETVERVLAETGLDPRSLEIELTESVMGDSLLLGDACRRLRRRGVRLAIDDFGAGFSSLTALKHTSIDTLKIDRQFVQGLVDDPDAPLLLETVLGMASGLQLTTVAEGVETLHEVQVLQAFGCQLAQGYYFSPPVPAEAIPALTRAAFFVRTAAG